MPRRQSTDPPDFGTAFTALLAAAGLTVAGVRRALPQDCRGLIGRSALYDWKKGQHLPQDPRALEKVVEVCLAAARERGAALGVAPGRVNDWAKLLDDARNAQNSRPGQAGKIRASEPGSILYGRPIGRWNPMELGVHRAIGGGPLPTYVRRRHDNLLDAVLDPAPAGNRLVVLRGGSSTGKSRAAYEAVLRQLPHWRVDYPRTTAALAQRLRDGIPQHTAVWLNELRHYADADGSPGVLAGLADLLAEDGRVVLITTLWPEYWAYYTADHHGGPGSPDPVATARGLLRPLPDLTEPDSVAIDPSKGGVIHVPNQFSAEDLARAHQDDDPVLEEAIGASRAAGSYGKITQYLAGVPDLLNHYAGPGADPYGRAIITTAMDAARLGHAGPYPSGLLQSAVTGYLTDPQRTVKVADWWDEALRYATRELKGAVQALAPVPPERGTGLVGYCLADYLDQHGRRAHQTWPCPSSLWDALIEQVTSPNDLDRLAHAAYSRGLYRHAARLWKKAFIVGDTGAASQLIGVVLKDFDRPGSRHAAQWAADLAALDNPWDVYWLLHTLREAGAQDAVTALLNRHPEDHVTLDRVAGVESLLGELCDIGAAAAFTVLAARAVSQVILKDPWDVARLLRALDNHEAYELVGNDGADELVTALLDRYPADQVAVDDTQRIEWLLQQLGSAGAHDAVTALATRAADQVTYENQWRVGELLKALHEAGAQDVAATLAARAADEVALDNPEDIASLLRALHEADDQDAVTALLDRHPADQVALDNPGAVARLLRALHQAEDQDAVTALLDRHPADQITLDDIWDVMFLLTTLREIDAEEAAAALAARAAAQVALDDPRHVKVLLTALRKADAEEAAAALAARAAAQAALDDPGAVAAVLKALRDAGKPDWLDRHPADQVALDDPGDVAALLRELREAGDQDAVAALLDRHPADQVALDHPFDICILLGELRWGGPEDMATALATRAAERVALDDDSNDFTWLLEELQEHGPEEALMTLATRAANAGKFDLLSGRVPAITQQFTFGREPDDTASSPWNWSDLTRP